MLIANSREPRVGLTAQASSRCGQTPQNEVKWGDLTRDRLEAAVGSLRVGLMDTESYDGFNHDDLLKIGLRISGELIPGFPGVTLEIVDKRHLFGLLGKLEARLIQGGASQTIPAKDTYHREVSETGRRDLDVHGCKISLPAGGRVELEELSWCLPGMTCTQHNRGVRMALRSEDGTGVHVKFDQPHQDLETRDHVHSWVYEPKFGLSHWRTLTQTE